MQGRAVHTAGKARPRCYVTEAAARPGRATKACRSAEPPRWRQGEETTDDAGKKTNQIHVHVEECLRDRRKEAPGMLCCGLRALAAHGTCGGLMQALHTFELERRMRCAFTSPPHGVLGYFCPSAKLRQTVPKMIVVTPVNLSQLLLSLRKTMPTTESAAMTTALHTAYAIEVSSARRERLKP